MIAGLVLAAGEGTRFGPDPKLLAEISGQPVLQRVLETMTRVRSLDRVVVVLGAHAEEILSRVRFGRAEPLICVRWHEGQSASLQCGVGALPEAAKIILTLGDQPLITTQLVERFTREPPGSRAAYHGNPGHPVVSNTTTEAWLSLGVIVLFAAAFIALAIRMFKRSAVS